MEKIKINTCKNVDLVVMQHLHALTSELAMKSQKEKKINDVIN